MLGLQCSTKLNILAPLVRCTATRALNTMYDPPYLDSLQPSVPIHETLNIQMRAYDFSLLESYQSLVYKIGKAMNLNVEDGWATPAKVMKVQRLRPRSTVVEAEYTLPKYERTIQISELPAFQTSVLLELLHAGLPQGVSLQVVKHTDEFERCRYVPDLELKELRDLLTTLGGPVKKK